MTERKSTLPLLIPHKKLWRRQMVTRGSQERSSRAFPPNSYAAQVLRPEVVAALEAA